jgi:Domain of unknown function (DUF1707)
VDEPVLASNADRERVMARLSDAHVEGRLTVEELDERVGAAQAARTLQDLDLVVANLPPPPAERRLDAEVALANEPYSGGQIAGMTALTILVPMGRLIGLVIALSLLRDERTPERRRLLKAWAYACAAALAVEVLAVAIFVLHV